MKLDLKYIRNLKKYFKKMSLNNSEEARAGVFVNIYDMYSMNNYTAALGVGIYHCGIEVHGVEYGYGGHPFPFSGIFEMIPKDSEELGESFRFKETIQIGKTDFNKQEIEQMVTLLGRDFRGIDYHLMNKNCNSFSSKFSKLICGEDIPPWVNRLAYLTTFVPFIEKMIPKEWISPVAIQHTLDQHMNETNEQSQNGTSRILSTESSSINSEPVFVGQQENKSKINIWPALFTNNQNENNDQNKAV